MYEEIKEKFDALKNHKGYIRINSTHPIDIYLGINELNQKSFVIITYGEIEEIESSKLINTDIRKREDGRVYISFDLLDNNMSDLFYKFCLDIIESTKKTPEYEIVSFVNKRWNDWVNLFKNPINTILGEREIKGLLGELVFLNEYMFKNYGIDNGLNSWMGPDLAHKDFEIEDTWYEIKTVSQNSLTVKISSIDQLDSNNQGMLVIIRLEPTNVKKSDYITLNQYVESIKAKLSTKQLLLFDRKLSYVNYNYKKEYDKYIYYVQKIEFYIVNDKFPRISKKMVPSEIARVSYEITIDSIRDFEKIGD